MIAERTIVDFDPQLHQQPSEEPLLSPISITEDRRSFIKDIPEDQLFVDYSYQRGVSPKVVKGILKDFRPWSIGTLVVSARGNDRYAILDGQNRWTAVHQLRPGMMLRCEVFYGLTREQEAEEFHQRNTMRSNLSAAQTFKAKLGFGDVQATAIVRVLDEFGISLRADIEQRGAKRGRMSAVRALQWIYDRGKESGLHETMRIITRAWPETNARDLSGDVVKGIFTFIDHYGNRVDHGTLIEKLSRVSITWLYQEGSSKISGGNTRHYGVAMAVQDAFNYRRPVEKQLTDQIGPRHHRSS